ncbi:MAG: phage tail sheath subtilisin-like domain-containing protein [Steroidobacteraceae bacterium]
MKREGVRTPGTGRAANLAGYDRVRQGAHARKTVVTTSSLGIEVEEERGPDQSITRLGTARTAFVGRTLRGPVNRPVYITTFTEFQHVFGGLWQPSPLGYAVEQFFDNGGREALIVRVINGARSSTLTLRAGISSLTLRAVRPGTREFLRASVDYDNIAPGDSAEFNLTVQRVRAQGTAQVEDQEIFHKLSVLPTGASYLPRAIVDSELIELCGDIPAQRPDRTLDAASGLATAYVSSNSDGDDGAPLTDYDLIGRTSDRTGLFALDLADYFNFLCIPPLSRDHDVGPSTLLVAARYCKERRALLMVDPPSSWQTSDDALRGMRHWNFNSENALMYFPRVLAHDKLRGHFESFAPCGAVAGMLARCDEASPVWAPAKNDEAVLRPGYRPTCLVSEDRRIRLASLGINTILAARSVARIGVAARTLAVGTAASADWQYLAARRLALCIVNSIERGTRWVAMAQPHVEVAEMVASQVRAFFEALHESEAFGSRRMQDAFFVACDQRSELQLVIGFAARSKPGFHSFRIVHSPSGSRVNPVSLNRLDACHADYSPAELEWVESLARRMSGDGLEHKPGGH